mmetsp:Transcript_69172/g.151063  ORF Transcript_69172/g.151063 Transcript_69172/m.151063 type:complete len:220 (-) Transcript_69172:601-1260(-)
MDADFEAYILQGLASWFGVELSGDVPLNVCRPQSSSGIRCFEKLGRGIDWQSGQFGELGRGRCLIVLTICFHLRKCLFQCVMPSPAVSLLGPLLRELALAVLELLVFMACCTEQFVYFCLQGGCLLKHLQGGVLLLAGGLGSAVGGVLLCAQLADCGGCVGLSGLCRVKHGLDSRPSGLRAPLQLACGGVGLGEEGLAAVGEDGRGGSALSLAVHLHPK